MWSTSWPNPFFLSSLLFGITSLLLAIIVPFFGKKDVHKIWSFFNFLVAWWGFFLASLCIAGEDKKKAEYIWSLANSGGVLIAAFFYHFVVLFCEYKKKLFLIFSYSQAYFFLVLTIFGAIDFTLAYPYNSFYYPRVKTPIYAIETTCWLLTVLYGHYILYKTLKRSSGEKKIEVKWLFIAVFIGFFFGGGSHWLQAFGLPVHPAWNAFITVYVLLVTYAIFRHRLLGIDLVVRKGLAYAILIGFITAIYILLLVLLERIFQKSIGTTYSICMLAIVILLGEPLRVSVQSFIDRFFYQGTITQLSNMKDLLTQELQKTDQMRAVATLAAGMAHEIKNPLTSIKTFAEYLPQRYDDPEFREKFTRIVVDEVDRVNNIVRQLLEFSKPKELDLKKELIVPILDDTLNLLNNNLLKNNIKTIRDYKDNPSVLVDKNQLKQAFLNLFLNSIQAMPGGGTLKVSTSVNTNALVISIQDTGPGIPKEQIPHIFDPFFTTKEGGTGLGLSIVHGIVTKHGGKIEVESDKYTPTAFNINFHVD